MMANSTSDTLKELKLRSVREAIHGIADFLFDYLPLINAHNTDFFVLDHWHRLVHLAVREELLQLTDDELCRLPVSCSDRDALPQEESSHRDSFMFYTEPQVGCGVSTKGAWQQTSLPTWKHSNLSKLKAACSHHSLTHSALVTPVHEFLQERDLKDRITVESFMNDKKSHEVHVMAELCSDLATSQRTKQVVDIGSGRGYLGCHLSLMHDLKVLGIDSCETNTSSADQRKQKLEKYWNGLVRNSKNPEKKSRRRRKKKEEGETSEPAAKPPLSHYVPVTHFVTSQTDLMQLVNDSFPGDSVNGNFMLTGLHTCGNLGSNIMRLFSEHRDLKVLCNVGCCYHLIEEIFLRNPHLKPDESDSSITGYPLCEYLVTKQAQLGHNARMLAAQPLERLADKCQLPSVSLYWRALLQIIIKDCFGFFTHELQVGRIASKCTDFDDYVERCWKKLNLDETKMPVNVAADYLAKYPFQRHMSAFFLLKALFAPCIEALILLDRLAFLLEQPSISDAHLVRLFDPVTSPRCYAIVAFKCSEIKKT